MKFVWEDVETILRCWGGGVIRGYGTNEMRGTTYSLVIHGKNAHELSDVEHLILFTHKKF